MSTRRRAVAAVLAVAFASAPGSVIAQVAPRGRPPVSSQVNAQPGRLRLELPDLGAQPTSGRPRDSVMNGALIGAVIGAVVAGTTIGLICHAYREPENPSCVPATLGYAAIGGAIGAGAGAGIDALFTRHRVVVSLRTRF